MLIKKFIFTGCVALSTLYPLTNAVAASCHEDFWQMIRQINQYGSFTIAKGLYRNDTIDVLYNDAHAINHTLCQVGGHDSTYNVPVIIRWEQSNWGNTTYALG